MKVGTICKLKVSCLGNPEGTLGVVFYDYGSGSQLIFENGNVAGWISIQERYDGFGINPISQNRPSSEESWVLEEVGFEESLAGYQLKSMMQVSEDYRKGVFNLAWDGEIKRERERQSESEPSNNKYEKCEVYSDGNRPAWLRFKRKIGEDNVQCCMLSAAMDYADFSHFEYADIGESLFPRWKHDGVPMYPKFVVFRKAEGNET